MNIETTAKTPRPGFTLVNNVEIYDVRAHILRAFEGVPAGQYLRPREIQLLGRRDEISSSQGLLLDRIKVALRHAVEGATKIEGLVADYDATGKLIAYAKEEIVSTDKEPTLDNLKQAVQEGDNTRARQILMSGDMGLAAELNQHFKAFNDPTVECCGRDAADCDCPTFEVGDMVCERPENRKLPENTFGKVTDVTNGRVKVQWLNRNAAPTTGSPDSFVKLTDLAVMYADAYLALGDRAEEIEDRARELSISIIVTGGFDSQDSDMLGDAMGDTVQTHLMIAFMRQPEMMDHHEEAML